jgi:hypothetical protein
VTSGLTRAQQVLSRVLQALPSAQPPIALVNSWTEGDDVFCLVYRQPEHYDGTLGLRRVVENDWTTDGVVRQVMDGELGEPLGSLVDTLR